MRNRADILLSKKTRTVSEPVYDGRWVASAPADTRAPLIQLYHPDFGHFQDEFTNEDVELPAEVVRVTTRFMGAVSGVYKNESSGGRIVGAQALMVGEVAAICVEEDNKEFGNDDPSNQAGLSYGRYWAQPNHAKIRENSCCPSFLIAITGASIAIQGAVWADKMIVQRLTDNIWLAHDTIFNDEAAYRNARVLYALARSL
ncbi:hypothetical protein GALMADRAFT_786775 [Galerina marginata CBS 339.88]|uniref:Uncharacterized protein n=1 Tax=Galerina marginata (strain CBS 339.88) TaxID=685588 RepID=A0A067SKM2_GALM3|nr:hypothetical protein GALMADRAFT_786775 [Galerina marginata CBS 339.88]